MIRISRLTDYASLLLAQMATSEAALHTAADLAAETHLPAPTVSKVLKALVRADLLASQRGAGGGYRLARSPERISVLEIISAMEGPVAITECVHLDGACDVERHCQVRGNWQQINVVVREALSNMTLSDLACPQDVRHSPLVQLGIRESEPAESEAQS